MGAIQGVPRAPSICFGTPRKRLGCALVASGERSLGYQGATRVGVKAPHWALKTPMKSRGWGLDSPICAYFAVGNPYPPWVGRLAQS